MLKRTLLVGAVLAASVGCGDSGSSPTAATVAPRPNPSPPPQPAASLTLTIFNLSYVSPGEFNTADVYFDIGLRETAGTGLAVKNIHLDIFRPNGAHVERRTFKEQTIRRLVGGNRIEPNGSWRSVFVQGVRTSIARGSTGWFFRFTVQWLDDTGTRGEDDDVVRLNSWSPL